MACGHVIVCFIIMSQLSQRFGCGSIRPTKQWQCYSQCLSCRQLGGIGILYGKYLGLCRRDYDYRGMHGSLSGSVATVWKQVTGMDYTHSAVSLTPEQIRHLPTILVQCKSYGEQPDPSFGQTENLVGFAGSLDPSAPDDVLIAIPATNYMEYSPSTNLFASRLYFTETRGGVLEANAMQGHNVVFDWENSRFGFAKSTCEYEVKNRNVPSADGFSTDCIVGEPVLVEAILAFVAGIMITVACMDLFPEAWRHSQQSKLYFISGTLAGITVMVATEWYLP